MRNRLVAAALCLAICSFRLPQAEASSAESILPIRCWAETETSVQIVGFSGTTLVVADSYGNALFGFDAVNCTEIWRYSVSGNNLLDAHLSNSRVVARFWEATYEDVSSSDRSFEYGTVGSTVALDPETGYLEWSAKSGAGYAMDFYVDSDVVVIDGQYQMELLNESTGETVWNAEASESGWFWSTTSVREKVVIRYDSTKVLGRKVGVYSGYELSSGDLLWSNTVDGGGINQHIDTPPDSPLVFRTWTDEASVVTAIDAESGKNVILPIAGPILDVYSDGDFVYYFAVGGSSPEDRFRLVSVDLSTGETRIDVGLGHSGLPVARADNVLVTIDDNYSDTATTTVRGFSTQNGDLLWTSEIENDSSVLGPAFQLIDRDLILVQDDRISIVSVVDGTVLFDALLPDLETQFSISEIGWCPEPLFKSLLAVAEDFIALATCQNEIAIFEISI